jgi:hypothetical protein
MEGSDTMQAYEELATRADAANKLFAETAVVLFERLREIDPDLATIAEDFYGSARAAAIAFAQGNIYEDRPTTYAELASGRRKGVTSAIVKTEHGMF